MSFLLLIPITVVYFVRLIGGNIMKVPVVAPYTWIGGMAHTIAFILQVLFVLIFIVLICSVIYVIFGLKQKACVSGWTDWIVNIFMYNICKLGNTPAA